MTAELELHRETTPTTDLAAQMDYARAVSVASLLPQAYRGKPADIMIAMGLGRAMGLNEAEALYRIDVIQGKPTASAELIASNVRKAGHRLRTVVDEVNLTATTSIWRSDDPDFEHKVTRDMAWAKRMGLDTKDNYKKQPATMLANRSITGAARLACPEALYGVAYTSDEMYDLPGGGTGGGLAAVLNVEPESEVAPEDYVPMTKRTRGEMFALFAQKGVEETEQLPGINHITGKDYGSRADITETDALAVIEVLKGKPDANTDGAS